MKPANTPTRMKASDFHPYILEIFDGYVHGKITKREFMREAGKFAAAGVTGLMILNQLQPDYAPAREAQLKLLAYHNRLGKIAARQLRERNRVIVQAEAEDRATRE